MTNLSWTVGDVTVTRVEESIAYIDPTALMPDFTPDLLEPHRAWLVPSFFTEQNTKLLLSLHSFVVRTHDMTIVVDTCVGRPDQPLPHNPEFPALLDQAIPGGLGAVDVVLCTHLHFDHVGWNTQMVDGELVPTFPNARYLFAEAEVAHTRTDDHMAVLGPSIDPLIARDLVDLVDTDHVMAPEVRLIPTPGHTPGHVSVLIESKQERALITGDLAHTPLQFAIPDLPTRAFDWDSEMSTATRRTIIDTYVDTDTLVLGTHFAPPTAGWLRHSGTHVRFTT